MCHQGFGESLTCRSFPLTPWPGGSLPPWAVLVFQLMTQPCLPAEGRSKVRRDLKDVAIQGPGAARQGHNCPCLPRSRGRVWIAVAGGGFQRPHGQDTKDARGKRKRCCGSSQRTREPVPAGAGAGGRTPTKFPTRAAFIDSTWQGGPAALLLFPTRRPPADFKKAKQPHYSLFHVFILPGAKSLARSERKGEPPGVSAV